MSWINGEWVLVYVNCMLLEKIHLESDERILTQVRRHWFILVSQIATLALAALLPLPVMWFANRVAADYGDTGINLSAYTPEILYLYGLWLLFLWIGLFSIWTNYYLDILTVTDRRAILINQKGLFRRNVTSFRLERLQDMNIEINGLLATLLDYGDVHAETAGHAEEEFKATGLPKPRELKGLILRAADERMEAAKAELGV